MEWALPATALAFLAAYASRAWPTVPWGLGRSCLVSRQPGGPGLDVSNRHIDLSLAAAVVAASSAVPRYDRRPPRSG
jgi:hypothetical protein